MRQRILKLIKSNTIEKGNYTGPDFAFELQSKIRAATNFRIYNLFNVNYNSKNNNLTISITDNRFTFKF
jgi:hypothetical protein